MKITRILEFKNRADFLLRGVLTLPPELNSASAVMMGGFERSCTTEVKFKRLADALAVAGIPSLRFDHTGVGLSDGDFCDISVRSLTSDLGCALKAIKHELSSDRVSFVSHSLPPCIMADKTMRDRFDKIVMISPALNQRALLRYWYVKNSFKPDPPVKITWDNYREYFDEESFQAYSRLEQKITKAHLVGPHYYLESMDVDYAPLIPDSRNILHIHGELDDTVPLASLTKKFSNRIIVPRGDHDVERPDFISYWLSQAVDFVIEYQ